MKTTRKRHVVGVATMLAGSAVCVLQAQAQTAAAQPWEVLNQYCVKCHNFEDWAGEIALDAMDRDNVHTDAETWEKVIVRLRSGLMPPAGEDRPERAVLEGVAGWVETALDTSTRINPGTKVVSRMNRTEYVNAVRDLLDFDAAIIAGSLPKEDSVEGFDNIAEHLTTSPTLLEGYLSAAMEISRQAVGNVDIGAVDIHYYRAGRGSQLYHIDGMAPGTRGGMLIEHNFPLDAEYVIRISASIQEAGWKNDNGRMYWCNGPAVDVAFNNKRINTPDYQSFRIRVPAAVVPDAGHGAGRTFLQPSILLSAMKMKNETSICRSATLRRYTRPLLLLLLSICLTGCGGVEEPAVSAEQMAELHNRSTAFEGREAQTLRDDADARALGGELFQAHCAACHGTPTRNGMRGAPDLVAGVFDYGDSTEAVRATITQGRHSIMPSHGSKIGEAELGMLVNYVESFSNGEEMDLFRQVAEKLYATNCTSCHGPEARGNASMGVPDLTDDYWQHGSSMTNIRLGITRGIESRCPPQGDILGRAEIELLTAYVLSLRAR